jgi:hypothetical protein
MTVGKSLVPAYGRVYKKASTCLADFDNNRDFYAMDIYRQGYTSKRELQDLANKTGDEIRIEIRYGVRLEKVTCVTILPEESHE